MPSPRKKTKRTYQSPKREAARDETRARIVQAAARVLGRQGWETFSLEAVARAAGVTRLTLYNQFGGRRALLEAVFDAQATSGGLGAIADAMQMDDPHAALERVVGVFCRFWSGSAPMHGLIAATMADPELAEAISQRNERRRQLLSVLVAKMVDRSDVARGRAAELVDTLFALTSYSFYSELAASRLPPAKVCSTIAELSSAAVGRCRPARSRRRSG